jgi:SAM-dependent methyltransferase
MNHTMSTDALSTVKAQYSTPDVIREYSTVGMFPSEAKIVSQFIPEGSDVLELGCGAGRVTVDMARRGYRMTGVDLMPTMLAVAKEQAEANGVEIDLRVMDVTELTFSPESYSCVYYSFNGLEQIPGRAKRQKVLEDVYRILEPGGTFILATRSGLAIGKRTLAWILIIGRYLLSRATGTNQEMELGDRCWSGFYCFYINPFRMRAACRALGFKLKYFNAEPYVNRGKEAALRSNFSNARMIFYVFKK